MDLVNLGRKDYDITFIEKGGHNFFLNSPSFQLLYFFSRGNLFIRSSMP